LPARIVSAAAQHVRRTKIPAMLENVLPNAQWVSLSQKPASVGRIRAVRMIPAMVTNAFLLARTML